MLPGLGDRHKPRRLQAARNDARPEAAPFTPRDIVVADEVYLDGHTKPPSPTRPRGIQQPASINLSAISM